MRIFLLILILANLALLAVQQGWLGSIEVEMREPLRLQKQIEPQRIHLLNADKTTDEKLASSAGLTSTGNTTPPSSASSATSTDATPTKPLVCNELGAFTNEDVHSIETDLAARFPEASISTRQTEQTINYMVYVPPYASSTDAERAAGELQKNGVENFFVIRDIPALKYGISLGILKSADAAREQVALLSKKGVKNAQVYDRKSTRLWLQVRAPEFSDLARKSAEIKRLYPQQDFKNCVG